MPDTNNTTTPSPQNPPKTVSQMRQQATGTEQNTRFEQRVVAENVPTTSNPMTSAPVTPVDPATEVKYYSKPFADNTQAVGQTSPQPAQQQAPQAPIQQDFNTQQPNNQKGRGFHVPMPGLPGCRSITCLGCIIPLLLVVGTIAVVVTKQEPFWGKAKSVVNSDITGDGYTKVQPSTEENDLLDLLAIESDDGGERIQVSLNEEDVANLMSNKLPDKRPAYVDLQDKRISMLVDVDADDTEPLWFYLNIDQDNGSLMVKDSGLGIVTVPEPIMNAVRKAFAKSLDTINLEKSGALLEEITGRDDLDITDVKIENDKIVFTVNADKVRQAPATSEPENVEPQLDDEGV